MTRLVAGHTPAPRPAAVARRRHVELVEAARQRERPEVRGRRMTESVLGPQQRRVAAGEARGDVRGAGIVVRSSFAHTVERAGEVGSGEPSASESRGFADPDPKRLAVERRGQRVSRCHIYRSSLRRNRVARREPRGPATPTRPQHRVRPARMHAPGVAKVRMRRMSTRPDPDYTRTCFGRRTRSSSTRPRSRITPIPSTPYTMPPNHASDSDHASGERKDATLPVVA